ncbi:hypothetical protein COV17_00065 [Candidatus Woesearchaeota archaeon CG10_big_fil_rev_8_21_14_0_10_36_11]|nr:MAG: hypothetical protein COV17_00065 [Candidatus Woesearchaeota archaeon CG10_big_fil_rev_8_21_14_0_10_36_11]
MIELLIYRDYDGKFYAQIGDSTIKTKDRGDYFARVCRFLEGYEREAIRLADYESPGIPLSPRMPQEILITIEELVSDHNEQAQKTFQFSKEKVTGQEPARDEPFLRVVGASPRRV